MFDQTANDKEAIGKLSYFPSQVIPANHFPYTNQQGYQSPFVMVQFTNPTQGKVIAVECKAWAENMRYNRKEGEGNVHFELHIDGV
jgi:sodium/potassium-transporting ATPase subunit beta